MAENQVLRFEIKSLWDGRPINHEPVEFCVSAEPGGALVKVDVKAPLFNDPGCPPSPAKQACDELWEYEVAEIFFLGDNERYLEVEFCPHGQHLVLLLDGTRNCFKDKLDLEYSATIDDKKKIWTGCASIPLEYFPPSVSKLNAFAIHGSGENRQYLALYPVTDKAPKPDFHRLQFFKEFDFKSMFPTGWKQPVSSVWQEKINRS